VGDARALDEIKKLAARNYIRFTSHAIARMRQRGANRADVKNALLSASDATWQTDHQSWHVTGGVDLDGDELSLAVDIEADVVVITVK
jgi:hypothetical protein